MSNLQFSRIFYYYKSFYSLFWSFSYKKLQRSNNHSLIKIYPPPAIASPSVRTHPPPASLFDHTRGVQPSSIPHRGWETPQFYWTCWTTPDSWSSRLSPYSATIISYPAPPASPRPKVYISVLADAASLYFYSPSIELLQLDSSSRALTCISGRGCLSMEFLCPFIKL